MKVKCRFHLQYLKSLEVITAILTIKTKLYKLKLNTISLIHYRTEFPVQNIALKSGEVGKSNITVRFAYLEQSP